MKKGDKVVCVSHSVATQQYTGIVRGEIYTVHHQAETGEIYLEGAIWENVPFPNDIFRHVEVKTPEEIAKLKHSWYKDPCWDIWATEGFELHEEELRQYAAECEKEWELEAKKREEALIANLKLEPSFIESHPNVVRLLLDMRAKINELEQKINNPETPLAFFYDK